MDDKYRINKNKKPETKQEMIQHQIEELVKRRDKETDLKAKQSINAEITKLFAQYQRLNL
jgi:ubiquinone biosynthesis protein COQ9